VSTLSAVWCFLIRVSLLEQLVAREWLGQ